MNFINVNRLIILAIGAKSDHIHILPEYNVNQLLPDLVEEIETSSNSLIEVKKYFIPCSRKASKKLHEFRCAHTSLWITGKYLSSLAIRRTFQG